MSKKFWKKKRKVFREEVKQYAEAIGKEIGNVIKPCPKWCPEFIYMKLLSIFIKIKK